VSALLVGVAAALQAASAWAPGTPLPEPRANLTTAAVSVDGRWSLVAALGLEAGRTWRDVTASAFLYDPAAGRWRKLPDVPGPGRLAGTARAWRGKLFIYGGYTVAEDGSERSVPNVDVLDVRAAAWTRAADIPVPTDDAVSGLWRDSLVYLVSGWHDRDNVRDVQVHDLSADRWLGATPIPGPPVFGHAGAVARDVIVYIDGVRVDRDPRRFVLEASSWRGDIDPTDPTRVTWRRIADHPGPPLYRAAAGAWGDWVIFAGGTDNPYNYSGVGYDTRPAEPRTGVFAYNVRTGEWRELEPLPVAVMDHRGLVIAGDRAYLIGGMEAGQTVTRLVQVADLRVLLGG